MEKEGLPPARGSVLAGMNAYLCLVKDVEILQEYVAGYPRYETSNLAGIVVAETRGRARSMFLRKHRGYWIDYTAIGCRIIARGVNGTDYGCLPDSHPLWEMIVSEEEQNEREHSPSVD